MGKYGGGSGVIFLGYNDRYIGIPKSGSLCHKIAIGEQIATEEVNNARWKSKRSGQATAYKSPLLQICSR